MTDREAPQGFRRWLYRLYLLLALIAAIFPWLLFLPWAAEHRFAPGLFMEQLFATRPTAIFAADVLYAAGVFVLFVFAEGRRLRMRHLWVYPLVAFGIGLCCALPLFLAGRERAGASA
jgi:hypothetical protein